MTNPKTSDVDEFQALHAKWAKDTFPKETLKEVVLHLIDEAGEALESPSDVTEWADCYMLLMYAAHRCGFSMSDVLYVAKQKHLVNLNRTWGGKSEKGIYEHVK